MALPLSLRLLPLLLAGGLTACASVGPDYRAPAVAVPAAWQAPSPDASASPQSLANWWEQLADPQLSALVADALAANPDLDAARAALRAARASRDAAAAQRAPSVSAGGGVTRSTALGGERTLYDAGFDAAWELDVFGGLRRAVEAADADRAAALADLRATRVSLVAEVALNYIDLRAAQMRLAIARANLASQTETLQITQWRSQAGLASALDVEQARSNRESTRAQIPTLDTGRAAAEHRLAVLAGRAPGSLHDVLAVADGARGGLLPRLPASVAVSIPAEALRQRPDITAAERRLAAATARVGQAEAARYPPSASAAASACRPWACPPSPAAGRWPARWPRR
jgi:NodT family efflux transporter outer membrane factor (OMF) lipoprotein